MKKINFGSDYDLDKAKTVRTPSQDSDSYYDNLSDEKAVRDMWNKKSINCCIYIVEMQYRDGNLPPYVWDLERCFLSKSQAIQFAIMLKNDGNDVRILRQINLRMPEKAYTIADDGKVIKHKQEKGGH